MSGAVSNDLTIPADMSGSAFSCIGYPPNPIGALSGNNGVCTAPDAYPLYSNVTSLMSSRSAVISRQSSLSAIPLLSCTPQP